MASRKHDPKSDAGSWVLIAVLFLVGLWPIALAVLLFKLFGRDGQTRRVPPPLEQQEMPGSIPTPVKKRGTGPVTPGPDGGPADDPIACGENFYGPGAQDCRRGHYSGEPSGLLGAH